MHVAAVVAVGAAIGVLIGLFGVGGSSVATPALSLAGVRALAAVASPLPATIPGALLAVRPYLKSGEARPKAAGWSLLGAVPATVLGALVSKVVGGDGLLVLSGVMLVVVGVRVIMPITDAAREVGTARRQNRPLLVAATAGVGFMTGLLANGGGFLLMPLYLLVFGLRMRQAVGTSLIVVAVLSIPTLITHTALGHVDWSVAAWFAAGVIPTSVIGGHYSSGFGAGVQRRIFGVFLIVFGIAFTAYRLLAF
ncbi:MAG TPA: sulfite exporter TauE/SafE family protein [Acidimicrobiales bacterium]|nr:sulfite exporter TauE/SafE family protein [Acidimicrobiales bacterium]